MAKNYVDEIRNKIESDIVLIGYDLNKNINIFYDNQSMYKNILTTQKLVRNVCMKNFKTIHLSAKANENVSLKWLCKIIVMFSFFHFAFYTFYIHIVLFYLN